MPHGKVIVGNRGEAGGKNLPVYLRRNKTFLPVYRQIIDRMAGAWPETMAKNIMKMAFYVKKRAHVPAWKGCGTKSAKLME